MAKIKKIAINASMLDEKPTGVGIYTYNLANTLSSLYKKEKQCSLTVFTPTTSYLNKDVHTIKISDLIQSSRYGKLAAFCRFIWNAVSYSFAGRGYDLLINTTSHGSFTLQNQVITIHDLLSLRYNNISAHQRFYFKYLLPLLVSRARLVITVSETTKQEVIKYMRCDEKKVHVVYNGYNKAMYNSDVTDKHVILTHYGVSDYFLAIGPTYPHKNFELLIETYRDLDHEQIKKHPLVIAGGKSPYLGHLKKLVSKYHLQKHVHFLGYVPSEHMPSLYKEAHLLIFPSLYEGFGFPVLEAMACGCPVLCSNASSIPEVGGDAVVYFEPSGKRSLTNAIHKVSDNKTIREELRKQGLQRAQEFSWERSAEKLKQLTDTYLFTIN
jgi:glycosyltransferase involved in cell wall biosynthesis